MRRMLFLILLTAMAVLLSSHAASAIGWGPRAGMTMDPDQAHFGMHLDGGEIVPRLRFQPNFEMGLGDDLMVAAFNFEAIYLFDVNRDNWRPYAGGGVGMNYIDWDRGPRRDESDTDIGMNTVGGIEWDLANGNRVFTELKFGLVDEPDLKWTVGFTFMH
ncbi:MAG: hypothetical protein AB1752_06430 [Candidatus Zixiibacteriota bacterium]